MNVNYANQVVILMAVYNGETYLDEQILSIVNQTYKDWILFISDDGSTDGTQKIVERYISQYKQQIFLVNNRGQNHGARSNFNNVMQHAVRSRYYMFSDQDDYWMLDKIDVLMHHMHDIEDRYGVDYPLLVYSDLEVVDFKLASIAPSFVKSSGLSLPEKNIMQQFLLYNCIPGCSMLFNSVLMELSSYIPDRAYMHDWWIALTAACFGKICYVTTPLVKYRQHQENSIGTITKQSQICRLSKIMCINRIHTLLQNNTEMKNIRNEQTQVFLLRYKEKLSVIQVKLIDNYIRILKNGKISGAVWALRNGFVFESCLYTIKFFLLK